MTVELYRLTSPVFVHNLKNLSAVMKTALKSARDRDIDPQVLLNSRLAPDMLPLVRQVQIMTDNAKGCCSRLTGIEAPVFADGDDNFAQLQQRITSTIRFIKGLKRSQFAASADDSIEMKVPIGTLYFSAQDYVNGWVLPNFYFHFTTAYNILRHNGVEVGKADFLGLVPGMSATGKIVKMMGLPQPKKNTIKKIGKKLRRKVKNEN